MAELVFHVEPDEWLPIETLRGMFHPDNSQVRDREELEAIKRSLLAEGFTAELIVANRWNQKVVSGHGRVEAAWQLGYRGKLPVVWREYGSEAEHRRAMLRFNLARGHQDPELLQREIDALLAEFQADAVQADMGFSEAEWGELAEGLDMTELRDADAPDLRRGLGDRKAMIKPVLYAEEIDTFERALRATGLANRGQAVLAVCRSYLERRDEQAGTEGQFDAALESATAAQPAT